MGEQVFNINFVRTVRRYPCVYDHGRLDYCLRHVTEAAWADIAKEVGEDVKTCKEKWKNLRTVFRRNLLKDGGASKRPYYLNEHMQFMIPLLHGSKKRGRSWSQYQSMDAGAVLEEPQSPWEDLSYEEDDDDRHQQEEEDPLLMVETVIKREPSSGDRKRQDEEKPSTTHHIKVEPDLEIKKESKRRDESVPWLTCKSVQMLRNMENAKELDGGHRSEARVHEEDRRNHSYDQDDQESAEGRKRLKTEHTESKTAVHETRSLEHSSGADPKRPHSHCFDCPDTQFLLSLKPDLEQMTPKQKRKFKKEIFNLLDTILDDQDSEASHNTTNLPSSTSKFVSKK